MADVKCPNCGTMNPAGQDVCRNCQTRLDSGTPPLHPGQAPTKKNTAELEPILPQWLRDARNQARKSVQEEAENVENQSKDKGGSSVDLLAGLQAQAGGDEDEVPDWLSNITGKSGKGKKSRSEESTEVRWVELGGTEELSEPAGRKKDSIPVGQAPVPTSGENELPPWLANVVAAQEDSKQDTLTGWLKNVDRGTQAPETPAETTASEKKETGKETEDLFPHFESGSSTGEPSPEWSNKPSVEQSPAIRRPEGFAPLEAGLPDWMKTKPLGPGRNQPPPTPPSEELPDWLKNLDSSGTELGPESPEILAPGTPDWLKGPADQESQAAAAPFMGHEAPAPSPFETTGSFKDQVGLEPETGSQPPGLFAAETPDWLKNLGGEEPATPPPASAQGGPFDSTAISDSPDWLKNLGAEEPAPSFTPAEPSQGEPFESTGVPDSPDWLKNLGAEEPAPSFPPAESSQGGSFGVTGDISDSPDWLKDLSSAEAAPSFTSTSLPAEPADISLGEAPDWLKDLGAIPSPDAHPEPLAPASASAGTFGPSSPAFASEGGQNVFPDESISKSDLDSLFKEVPDWLAAVGGEERVSTPPAGDMNVIAPGSLPSWVEAMRPVESSIAQGGTASGPVGDQTLEARGPLAGLYGVLPAVPFLGPSSKPKTYSIKLTASEEQQAHAGLLDEVLAAETMPVPIVSLRQVASQRVLRLSIAVLLFLVVGIAALAGTQIFPLPLSADISREVQSGLESVWAIPEGAPVLVVFDYEPALAGEMEAIAAPLLDQMILLRHPRLTLLSTATTGATLAERLFSGPLAGHNYQRGVQYLNLGYLPGGLSGVRAFVQDPPASTPFAFDGTPAWQSPPLQGVQTFAQFAAIILLTDSGETGRIWIEQRGQLQAAPPMVIAASAQAGPLLHPYFQSGQINGLMTGLHDSAVIEQINAGRPGTARRYWDSYNLGLLIAMAFILGGSLMSMVMGLREHAEAES